MDDQALINGYLAHHKAAIEQVDAVIRQAAAPYHRKLVPQWDDVLQDIHLELWQVLNRGQYSGSGSLKGYIWRVTAHTCLDKIRYSTRWQHRLEQFQHEPRQPVSTPMAQLLGKKEAEAALAIFAQMPAECRTLWKMILAGKSYRQMSDALGINVGALRVRVLRCRQKAVALRNQLLGEGAPGDEERP